MSNESDKPILVSGPVTMHGYTDRVMEIMSKQTTDSPDPFSDKPAPNWPPPGFCNAVYPDYERGGFASFPNDAARQAYKSEHSFSADEAESARIRKEIGETWAGIMGPEVRSAIRSIAIESAFFGGPLEMERGDYSLTFRTKAGSKLVIDTTAPAKIVSFIKASSGLEESVREIPSGLLTNTRAFNEFKLSDEAKAELKAELEKAANKGGMIYVPTASRADFTSMFVDGEHVTCGHKFLNGRATCTKRAGHTGGCRGPIDMNAAPSVTIANTVEAHHAVPEKAICHFPGLPEKDWAIGDRVRINDKAWEAARGKVGTIKRIDGPRIGVAAGDDSTDTLYWPEAEMLDRLDAPVCDPATATAKDYFALGADPTSGFAGHKTSSCDCKNPVPMKKDPFIETAILHAVKMIQERSQEQRVAQGAEAIIFERYTDRARKVVQLARQEADRFNAFEVGTDHVLLALVKEGSGVAAHVLKDLGLDLRRIRLAAEIITPTGPTPETVRVEKLPFSTGFKMMHESAHEEMARLKHGYIGTEHLLLGLLSNHVCAACQILTSLGVQRDAVRDGVVHLLGCPPDGPVSPLPTKPQVSLATCISAKEWASEFVRITQARPDITGNVSVMTTWFANAMMAMHDHAKREQKKLGPNEFAIGMPGELHIWDVDKMTPEDKRKTAANIRKSADMLERSAAESFNFQKAVQADSQEFEREAKEPVSPAFPVGATVRHRYDTTETPMTVVGYTNIGWVNCASGDARQAYAPSMLVSVYRPAKAYVPSMADMLLQSVAQHREKIAQPDSQECDQPIELPAK